MGGSTGGGTVVNQVTPPPQPSTADAIKQYVESLPELFQAQLDFAPKEAQQQLDLAQQFALPLAEIAKQSQAALYPETTQLQEQLAGEAAAGIRDGVPQATADRFRDEFRANLGTNVGSPIGAEATARGVVELDESYKRYFRDLALSVAGRQPLSQPQAPGFTNQLGNFSPNDALNFQAQNYNTFAQAGRPITTQNAGRRTATQGFGDVASGVGGLFNFTKTF